MKTLAQWKELTGRIHLESGIRYARKKMEGLSENLLESGYQTTEDSQ
jgi:hypothetical protein